MVSEPPVVQGLLEDLARLRDAETDPARRLRYNIALNVLAEIVGESDETTAPPWST